MSFTSKFTLPLVLTLALMLSAPAAFGQTGNSRGGGTGSVTNLPSYLTNLLIAGPFTNANQVWSNVVVVNPTANVLTNGILLTNAVKYAGTLASATRRILVWMNPGHYHTPTNTLPSVMFGVENVSTYWMPGAVWSSGKHAGETAYMFDDLAGVRTNCHVYGYGRFFATNDSVNVLYLENASRVRFEADSMYATSGTNLVDTAGPFTWGGAACDIDILIRDYIEAPNYDAIYGDVAAGQKLRGYIKEVRAAGDLFEFNGDSPAWGNIDLRIDIGRQTVTNLQPTFLQPGGRTKVSGSQIFVTSLVASIGSAATATNGIVEGFVIQLPANSTAPAIAGNSTSIAGMHLRNLVIYGPTNVDMITISNTVTMPLILENCTFYNGWASTNWIRGATPSYVSIIGGLGLVPYKPIGSQITVLTTNYQHGIRNAGRLLQEAPATFSGGDVAVNGYDLYAIGAYFDSFIATNLLNIPNGAGPFAPGDGDIMFDNNYWGAGRGAIVTWDGTANVVIPAAQQSDIPSNGQVMKFNTGGTFTWEDDNNSGGGSSNYTTIASGSATVGALSTTNNVTHPGNVVNSGTNIVSGALRLPVIATNTVLFLDGSSNVVGRTLGSGLSQSAGAIIATGSTNPVAFTAGSIGASNYFGLGFTNTGSNATQVIDMMGPQVVRSHVNGNTTFVYTNMPAWTNAGSGSELQHYIQHTAGTVTIASLHPIKFDPSLFIASGETNLVTTAWNGVEIIGTTSHAPLVFHSSVAATIVLDSQYSRSSIFSLTNRLTQATTLIATNLSDGKQMRINIIGEASGGTSRAITIIPDLGTLIVNMNTYAQSKTNSFVFTVTNGMFAEVSGETLRMNGTNTLKLSVAHASFQ